MTKTFTQSKIGRELMLSLDYDNVTNDFILSEFFMLKHKFRIPLSLYSSSKGHYHIRSLCPVTEELGFKILEFSRCSKSYKVFCRRVKMFPIRTGQKHKIHSDGSVEVSPIPFRVL